MTDVRQIGKPCVVVSQPMYFPWVGQLEQIRLCDAFVYYDDVQFARGFFNRVQIKTKQGVRWMTVPLKDWRRGQLINEVRIDNEQDWKRSHLALLREAYSAAPFCADMLHLVGQVFSRDYEVIGDLARASTDVLIRYFSSIGEGKQFLISSSMNIPGSSSQRLIDICLGLRMNSYLTGHGARNYLNHEAFEVQGIEVDYIDYELFEYIQLHPPFTPYVSSLDLVAHCGSAGIGHILGQRRYWKNFLNLSLENEKNI